MIYIIFQINIVICNYLEFSCIKQLSLLFSDIVCYVRCRSVSHANKLHESAFICTVPKQSSCGFVCILQLHHVAHLTRYFGKWLFILFPSLTLVGLQVFLFGFITLYTNAQSYDCTYAGRFPYYNTGCKSYYICAWSGSTLVRSNYTCPTVTLFNPTTQKCATTYTCTDNICNRTGVTENQMFYNPNGSGCNTFIKCVFDSLNAVPLPQVGQCASGSIFDPSLCNNGVTAGSCIAGATGCTC